MCCKISFATRDRNVGIYTHTSYSQALCANPSEQIRPMTTDKEQEKISGWTYIKDGLIIWANDKSETLEQIPIKDVKIIGEFTTSAGPIQDDWFFVFILSKEDIRQISAYAIGTEEIFRQVGQHINADISGQLAASTDCKTNTLWPTHFRGQGLFKATGKQPTNIWKKLKSKLGLTETDIELTEDLKKHLG